MKFREIGDWIKLNHKSEDYPMISLVPNQWERHIKCQIVFICMDGSFRVKNNSGIERVITEDDIE